VKAAVNVTVAVIVMPSEVVATETPKRDAALAVRQRAAAAGTLA
jgi:hypothetical protein